MAIYQLANLTSSDNTFTGTNKFNTSSGDNPLCISRNTSTSEITSIYQNDTGVFFDILNDEATTHITFKLKATDTESGGGANASEGSVAIALGAGNKTSVTASSFTGSLSGNATSANSAVKATKDADGRVIADTYLNKDASTQAVSAKTTFSNTTNSSSVSSGAVIIKGGLGVAKNITAGTITGSTANITEHRINGWKIIVSGGELVFSYEG